MQGFDSPSPAQCVRRPFVRLRGLGCARRMVAPSLFPCPWAVLLRLFPPGGLHSAVSQNGSISKLTPALVPNPTPQGPGATPKIMDPDQRRLPRYTLRLCLPKLQFEVPPPGVGPQPRTDHLLCSIWNLTCQVHTYQSPTRQPPYLFPVSTGYLFTRYLPVTYQS